jgi:predicted membrane channel-forming protein YqfA (hemolysin III family)
MGSTGNAGFAKFEPGDADPGSIELGLAGGREAGSGGSLLAGAVHGSDDGSAAAAAAREDAIMCWSYSAGRARGQPACMAPNWTVRPYIHWYYRDVLTPRQAVASLWYCHNETGNVLTHLGGLLVFVLLFVRDLFFRELPVHHRVVTCSYLLVAQFCMGSSAAFHLLGPVSKRGYELALRCDMTGIALVIVSSFMIGIHYGYWCHESTGHIYNTIVGVLSCIAIAIAWPGPVSKFQCVCRLLCLVCGLRAGPTFPLVLSCRWAQQVSYPSALPLSAQRERGPVCVCVCTCHAIGRLTPTAGVFN